MTGSPVVSSQIGSQGSPQVSSQSSSQLSPLMDSSHGTSADTVAGSSGSGGPVADSPTGVVQEVVTGSRRPKWLTSTLRDADSGVPPRTYVRESIPPKRFCSYVALVTGIVDSEPGSFDEASAQQVWRDAIMEEYNSIMKNGVWEVVLIP